MYENLSKYLAANGLKIDKTKVANRTDLITKLQANLADNKTYLALPTPTAAQKETQIAKLTRENNRLIRLVIGLLDMTE